MKLKEFELNLRMLGWEVLPEKLRQGFSLHKQVYSFNEYVSISRLEEKNQLSLTWQVTVGREFKLKKWHTIVTREFHSMLDYVRIAHAYGWNVSKEDVETKALKNEG